MGYDLFPLSMKYEVKGGPCEYFFGFNKIAPTPLLCLVVHLQLAAYLVVFAYAIVLKVD